MTVSRRSFLGGALALTAFALGLNALFAGEPVDIENEVAILNEGRIYLTNGVFRVCSDLFIRQGNTTISGGTFIASSFKGPMLSIGNELTPLHVTQENIHFRDCDWVWEKVNWPILRVIAAKEDYPR